MALVKCLECGNSVSTTANSCPKCGAQPPEKAVKAKKNDHIPTWQGLLILIGVFAALIFYANYSLKPSESSNTIKARQLTDIDALYMCQTAIKTIATDPENAKVPYVKNFGTGNEYYFAWGRSTTFARMRNAFGNDMPVSASCIVDSSKRKITSLTVDGKSVLGN